MDAEFLTCSDVAKLAQRTPATIREAADAGRLHVAARTAGGVRLFRRADVEVFLRKREQRDGQ
ncbi:MAG: helix-turn-helix domain-containing protein [Candidatus Binatia bacterium]